MKKKSLPYEATDVAAPSARARLRIRAGGAVASARERLAKPKPTLKRGRPSSKDKEARRLARQSTTMQEKINDVFQHRFVFVKRRLTPSERQQFVPITRGLPHLRK